MKNSDNEIDADMFPLTDAERRIDAAYLRACKRHAILCVALGVIALAVALWASMGLFKGLPFTWGQAVNWLYSSSEPTALPHGLLMLVLATCAAVLATLFKVVRP